MSARRIVLLAVVGFFFGGAQADQAAMAREQVISIEERAFFSEIRDAILSEDAKRLAGMVVYPQRLCIGGKVGVVKNQDEFEMGFSDIVNQRVRGAVLGQSPDQLFKNWRGVMVGDGEIWFVTYPPYFPPNSTPVSKIYIKSIRNEFLKSKKGTPCRPN